MELRARGVSYEQIAEQIKVSKPTLIKWSRQYETQIAVLQDGELEAMLERFRLTRKARVERYAKVLDQMEDQLKDRDLSTVATDRLLRIYLRALELARLEIDPQEISVSYEESALDRWERLIKRVGVVPNILAVDVAPVP